MDLDRYDQWIEEEDQLQIVIEQNKKKEVFLGRLLQYDHSKNTILVYHEAEQKVYFIHQTEIKSIQSAVEGDNIQ